MVDVVSYTQAQINKFIPTNIWLNIYYLVPAGPQGSGMLLQQSQRVGRQT